jgi:hypothetical protein
LTTLDIPRPFDLTALIDRLSQERGRPITLQPWPGISGPGAPSGIWLETETADHIFYEHNTSSLHREQIVLHECAHMLLGHGRTLTPQETSQILPDLGPSLINRALARTCYTTTQEQEAETLASLILQAAYGQHSEPTWQIPAEQADIVDRLDRSLRHDPRA